MRNASEYACSGVAQAAVRVHEKKRGPARFVFKIAHDGENYLVKGNMARATVLDLAQARYGTRPDYISQANNDPNLFMVRLNGRPMSFRVLQKGKVF